MEKQYQVFIIDDDSSARELTKAFVNKIPFLSCSGMFSSADNVLEAIKQQAPDLLLLDLNMPKSTRLEILPLLETKSFDVILTSNHPDFAVKSYDYGVIDYLLQPVDFERFVKATLRFYERKKLAVKDNSYKPLPSSPFTSFQPEDMIWIKEEKKLVQLNAIDILYIEGLKDYIKVFLTDTMIMSHMTIGKAQEQFAPPHFVRIHRSYIVRRSAIRVIYHNFIELTQGKKLPLGPLYKEEFKNSCRNCLE